MTAATLSAALDLASQGYAVFPCRPDKKPACPHGFHDATSDAASLRELWQRFPGALIGVATGTASGICVVDIDCKHTQAHQWWGEHRARLLPTRVHRTRSGGLHLIYGDCPGLKCSAARIAKGVDVRAGGGYVLWWPAAGLPTLCSSPIASWPEWLRELAMPPAPVIPIRFRPAATINDIRSSPRRLYGLIRLVALAPVGERNARLFWSACRLRDMLSSGELTPEGGRHAVACLHEAAVRTALPSLEIQRTIASALSGGLRSI
jgi:hypothetical protein